MFNYHPSNDETNATAIMRHVMDNSLSPLQGLLQLKQRSPNSYMYGCERQRQTSITACIDHGGGGGEGGGGGGGERERERERERREREERVRGGSTTHCFVVSLTIGQPFLLIVPTTLEWLLTVGTHKVLESRGREMKTKRMWPGNKVSLF